METVNIELEIKTTIDVDVDISELIDSINNIEVTKRWNIIAKILNEINLDSTNLNQEQRNLVKKYLSGQLEKFK